MDKSLEAARTVKQAITIQRRENQFCWFQILEKPILYFYLNFRSTCLYVENNRSANYCINEVNTLNCKQMQMYQLYVIISLEHGGLSGLMSKKQLSSYRDITD